MEPRVNHSEPRRAALRVLIAAVFASQAALAAAQAPCTGALPKAKTPLPQNGEKFALVSGQCGVFAEPGQVRRSPFLDVYNRPDASVTVRMAPELQPEAPPAPAAPSPTGPVQPLGRDSQRILTVVPALAAAAREHGLDPLLLHAIAHVESRHNVAAISPVGARGVMQVMPATGQRFGVSDERALLNAETNVRAGAAYLRTLRERYGNDLRRVIAAYNAGEGAVDKYGDVPPYPETQAYVRDVLAVYQRLREEFTATPEGDLRKAQS